LLASDKTPSLGHHYVGKQRKLLDVRVKNAIDEIKNTQVAPGKVRIWSLLNMGAVIKSSDKVIALDTANIPYVSSAHNELAETADIFLTTHSDSDHYDRALLLKALESDKTLAFPDGFYFQEENNPNIFKLASGQRTSVDDIYITAYKTDHRGDGNFQIPVCWYLIEIGDIKILYSGDGLAFQNPTESQRLRDRQDIDVFLANLMLSDENVRGINPKVIVPLHLFKYMHSQEELDKSTFASALAKYSGKIGNIDLKLLFAGESFVY
jgi:L-ascorbate metabolism protein UlaG (beta-lactamase superfamily)